jgi:hypothetical protein
MITNKELNEVSLSPTKKDYYQIWGELLDLASKISTRWSPDSTNESDPGIVLLKALTAIADKYLGKGKKVGDCTPSNAPQLDLILMELRELV